MVESRFHGEFYIEEEGRNFCFARKKNNIYTRFHETHTFRYVLATLYMIDGRADGSVHCFRRVKEIHLHIKFLSACAFADKRYRQMYF